MKEPGPTANSNESRADWYHSLFELSMDAMCIVAPDGTLIDVNRAWLALFGYTRDDLSVLNVRNLYVDPAERDDFVRRMAEDGSVNDEVRYRKKDGTVFLCRRSEVARKDESGRVIAYQGVLHDITDERATEEALRQSEERYRLLAENALDVIWVYSLPERRYTYVSPAAARLYGCTLEEASSATISDHLTPESLTIVEHVLREIEESGPPYPERYSLEVEQLKKDGTRFWTDLSISVVLSDGGAPHSLIGITRDITVRKQAEQKLEQMNDELRRLAARLHAAREEERARVSLELHEEVGQALSAVKMDLAMLRWNLHGHSQGEACAVAERMDSLLDECVSRLRGLETGLKPAMLEDLGLTAAIEWQLSEFAVHTGISYGFSRLDDIAIPNSQVCLSAFRVFQEALSRIAQYTDASAVDVSVCKNEAEVTISVHDNGHGSTGEEMPSQDSAGTLNMRERLRPFRGSVEIVGLPSEGTTVHIRIPMTDE